MHLMTLFTVIRCIVGREVLFPQVFFVSRYWLTKNFSIELKPFRTWKTSKHDKWLVMAFVLFQSLVVLLDLACVKCFAHSNEQGENMPTPCREDHCLPLLEPWLFYSHGNRANRYHHATGFWKLHENAHIFNNLYPVFFCITFFVFCPTWAFTPTQ